MRWPAEQLRAWEQRALRTLDELGTTWTLEVRLSPAPRTPYPTLAPRTSTPRPQTNTDVIDGQEQKGLRPFGLTDAMRSEIAAAVRADVRARGLSRISGAALATLVASHWRRVVVEHRRRGEGMPTPSARWTARKGRLGLSTDTYVASDQLLTSMAGAQLIVRRKV